jgi:hypothetical protein
LPEEIEQQIDSATERFRRQLEELCRWSYQEDDEDPPTAAEIEERIQEWIQQIGKDTLSTTMGQLDLHRPKGKRSCPCCGEEVYWKRYEPRRYVTTLGTLWLERAYYYHGACHCGWVPLDERLELGAGELSPLVQERSSWLGASMPFEQAQRYLARHHGIEISADTVNNYTIRVGKELKRRQESRVRLAWSEGKLPAVETGGKVGDLYVSVDGIYHLQPDGQGKELKVAAIYETKQQMTAEGPQMRAVNVEYVTARQAKELAKAAYVRSVRRGVHQSHRRIVLGDGAHWIWTQVPPIFRLPDCAEIVDFHHATDYLWKACEEAYGEGSDRTKAWANEACHRLKHEGAQVVMKDLAALPVPRTKPAEAIASALSYFDSHQERMNYPVYRQQGLQIGSGTAESGVQRVVGMRMNQPGMRWNTQRAECVAHARATLLSARWDAFWSSYTPPPRQYRARAA